MKLIFTFVLFFSCSTRSDINENDVKLILNIVSNDIKQYKPNLNYSYKYQLDTQEDMERVVGTDYELKKINNVNFRNLNGHDFQSSRDSLIIKFSDFYLLENKIYLHAEYFSLSNGILSEERFLYRIKRKDEKWLIDKISSESITN